MEVASGRLRWILAQSGGFTGPADGRPGSAVAFAVVERARVADNVSSSTAAGATLYDCRGRSAEILRAAQNP